jgi:predicted DNA-binding transcriptional regulator AlpA
MPKLKKVTRPEPQPDRYLDKSEVLELIPISHVALWHWIRLGKFPPGRNLIGGQRICWLESEVREWMNSQPRRYPKGYVGTKVAS